MSERDIGELHQAVRSLMEDMARHSDQQTRDLADLHKKWDALHEVVLKLQVQNVMVRAGATTIVKLILWTTAVVGGAVAAWDWARQHVTLH